MKLSAAESPGYMTNLAARLFARAIDRRLKPLGLTSGQLPVLFALGDGLDLDQIALAGAGEIAPPALSQKQLVEIAEIEQPTMAATLSRMERDGLITRRPDPADGRSALIALTPAALQKLPAVRAALQAVNKSALAGLEGEEAQFLRLLGRVVSGLKAEAGDA